MKNTRQKGNIGEDFAAKVLEDKGYRILCRNYKGKHGEIDIICEKSSYIVFTEVKLREILTERPASAVDNKKMAHIKDALSEFMSEYMDNNYIASLTPRIDIFEIICKNGVITDYFHIENVER